MNKETFVNLVFSKLPAVSSEDTESVKEGIAQMHREGYSIHDAVSFCLLLEEVNPVTGENDSDDEESDRLQRMSEIKKKYAKK